jgi:hypothetical protein
MESRFEVRKDDPYLDKLLKYIPPEVVAAYITIDGALRSAYDVSKPDQKATLSTWLWIISAVLLVLTPLWRWRVTKVTNKVQLAVTAGSFAVWVFALGGPFAFLQWYLPVHGSIVLPIYTLIVPIVFSGSE